MTLSWFGELILEIPDIQFYGTVCQLDAMTVAESWCKWSRLGGGDRATLESGRGRLRCSGEEKSRGEREERRAEEEDETKFARRVEKQPLGVPKKCILDLLLCLVTACFPTEGKYVIFVNSSIPRQFHAPLERLKKALFPATFPVSAPNRDSGEVGPIVMLQVLHPWVALVHLEASET